MINSDLKAVSKVVKQKRFIDMIETVHHDSQYIEVVLKRDYINWADQKVIWAFGFDRRGWSGGKSTQKEMLDDLKHWLEGVDLNPRYQPNTVHYSDFSADEMIKFLKIRDIDGVEKLAISLICESSGIKAPKPGDVIETNRGHKEITVIVEINGTPEMHGTEYILLFSEC